MSVGIEFHDFDGTLVLSMATNAEGVEVRLQKEMFANFCRSLGIEIQTVSQIIPLLFRNKSDTEAFKLIYEFYTQLHLIKSFPQEILNKNLQEPLKIETEITNFAKVLFEYVRISTGKTSIGPDEFLNVLTNLRVEAGLETLNQLTIFPTSIYSEILKNDSQQPLIILTNSYSELVVAQLKKLGYMGQAVIIGLNELRSLGIYGKPDPNCLHVVREKLFNQYPNLDLTTYVGDSEVDREFAEACGMRFIHYNGENERLSERELVNRIAIH